MSKPPSKCRRIELHFVTLQDKINLIKESESFPKPSRSCLLVFFWYDVIWCLVVFSHLWFRGSFLSTMSLAEYYTLFHY